MGANLIFRKCEGDLEGETCEGKDRAVWSQSRKNVCHEASSSEDENRTSAQLICHHDCSSAELLSDALILSHAQIRQLNSSELLSPVMERPLSFACSLTTMRFTGTILRCEWK